MGVNRGTKIEDCLINLPSNVLEVKCDKPSKVDFTSIQLSHNDYYKDVVEELKQFFDFGFGNVYFWNETDDENL